MAIDVAVIGGGIVGAAAAAFLAEGGATVALYERTAIGAGASGRNSGVVQQPGDALLAGLYHASVALYRELEGFALPAVPSGLLHVGLDPAAVRTLAEDLARADPGVGAEFLPPGEAHRLEPALAHDVAACRVVIGYPVPPASATAAFAARAERAGATIRIGEAADVWRRDGRAAGVRVGGASIGADVVLVAAGPWSPAVIDPSGAWRPIRPLWGVVVALELAAPPVHVLEEVAIDAGIAPGGAAAGVDFSLVTAAGSSSLGSTFLDDEPDAEALVPHLVAHGSRFVPAIAGAPVLGVRSCARPLARDGRPLVGRVPGVEGLWIAAGHGPWGISTGPASARQVADAILGGGPVPAGTDPARFSGA